MIRGGHRESTEEKEQRCRHLQDELARKPVHDGCARIAPLCFRVTRFKEGDEVRLIAKLVLALTLMAGGVFGLSGVAAQSNPATPTPTPSVVREVLSQGEPSSAPGQVLQLVRFVIAPHAKLPVHTHPGMQTAWLESGDLTYTIVKGGPITVNRAGDGNGTPGPVESLGEGQTTIFHPGDSWAEPKGMVHFAENAGDVPVVILVASLFPDGAPPSTVIQVATPIT
jgi:quercetin dioxygenase-like cupin family protein